MPRRRRIESASASSTCASHVRTFGFRACAIVLHLGAQTFGRRPRAAFDHSPRLSGSAIVRWIRNSRESRLFAPGHSNVQATRPADVCGWPASVERYWGGVGRVDADPERSFDPTHRLWRLSRYNGRPSNRVDLPVLGHCCLRLVGHDCSLSHALIISIYSQLLLNPCRIYF